MLQLQCCSSVMSLCSTWLRTFWSPRWTSALKDQMQSARWIATVCCTNSLKRQVLKSLRFNWIGSLHLGLPEPFMTLVCFGYPWAHDENCSLTCGFVPANFGGAPRKKPTSNSVGSLHRWCGFPLSNRTGQTNFLGMQSWNASRTTSPKTRWRWIFAPPRWMMPTCHCWQSQCTRTSLEWISTFGCVHGSQEKAWKIWHDTCHPNWRPWSSILSFLVTGCRF